MQPLSQKSDVIAEVPKTFFLIASSGQLKYRPLVYQGPMIHKLSWLFSNPYTVCYKCKGKIL